MGDHQAWIDTVRFRSPEASYPPLRPCTRNIGKRIIIAGDDDKHLELTHGINPGRSKAEEAARAVGGKVLLPIFAPNENSYPAGLQAITPQMFRKGQLSDQQHKALAKMKQYTDFNDLETKSVLGNEAVERQIRPIVESLIKRRQARNLQDKERVQLLAQHLRIL